MGRKHIPILEKALPAKGNPIHRTSKVLEVYTQEMLPHGDDLVIFIDYIQKIPLNRNRRM